LKVSALPEAGGLSRILVYDQKGGLIKAENVSSSPTTQQGILGFYGERSLVLAKSPSMGKKFTIETRNVWGATTCITVEVEPYSKPLLPAIEELGYWLFLLVATAIAFSLAMFFLSAHAWFKNGYYSYFMIWGQFWASHLLLIFLQYPPFSNRHRCLSFLKGRVTVSLKGSERSLWA